MYIQLLYGGLPKIKRLFSIKDKVPVALRSGVIYKFQCEVDPRRSYISKTYRHLGKRIKEHRSKLSAIYGHRLNCSCNFYVNNAQTKFSNTQAYIDRLTLFFIYLSKSPFPGQTGDGQHGEQVLAKTKEGHYRHETKQMSEVVKNNKRRMHSWKKEE